MIFTMVYMYLLRKLRDNGRVDIAKLDLDDNFGDSLTGAIQSRLLESK